MQITKHELARANAAAKMVEYDAEEAFNTCCNQFGKDVAIALLVAFYRREVGSMRTYPTPDDVIQKVQQILEDKGLLING